MTAVRCTRAWLQGFAGVIAFALAQFAQSQITPPPTPKSPSSRFFVLADLGERTGDPIWQLPQARIADGGDGFLYTTSSSGGTHGAGTVFKFSPSDGKPIVPYNFDSVHGAGPQSGLTRGSDGSFYGTTYSGGKYGVGTIFKITAAGALTVLWDFRNGAVIPAPVNRPPTEQEKLDAAGSYPVSAPIQVGTVMYGVTSYANNQQWGVVYVLSGGQYHGLYLFNAADAAKNGTFPFGLSAGPTGNVYGTALKGGLGWGTVYQVAGSGVNVLHQFDANGSGSLGVVQDGDGMLYGAATGPNTSFGMLYKLDPGSGAYQVIHTFDGDHGAGPVATPIIAKDGMLYGVTKYGGRAGRGVIYRLNRDGSDFAVLFEFDMNDGRYAMSPLIEYAGLATGGTNFFGVTYQGGTKDAGAIYRLNLHLYPTPSHDSAYQGGTNAVSDPMVIVQQNVNAYQDGALKSAGGISVKFYCPRDPHIVQFVLRSGTQADGTAATGTFSTSWGTFQYGQWHPDAIGFPNAYYDQAPGASHRSELTDVIVFDRPDTAVDASTAHGWTVKARDFAICNGRVLREVNWAVGVPWNAATNSLGPRAYSGFAILAPAATDDPIAWSNSKLDWINSQLKAFGYDPVP